jgi:hypothetical protein
MGFSEWGVPLHTLSDARFLRELVLAHNAPPGGWADDVGEPLFDSGLLRFQGRVYQVLASHGGRDCTSNFIHEFWPPFHEVLHPFCKPGGWGDCHDWVAGEGRGVLTLGDVELERALTAEGLRPGRRVRLWPQRWKRVSAADVRAARAAARRRRAGADAGRAGAPSEAGQGGAA